jgi:hypothetical protein
MSSCIRSGSRRSAKRVESTMSQKRIVTCLRSPSRAILEVRIFSARCFGVYEEGAAAVTLACTSPAPFPSPPCPHFLQNLYVGALAVPQATQTTTSLAPHSGQKSASNGASCWHRGHFIAYSPRAGRGSGLTTVRFTVSNDLQPDNGKGLVRPVPDWGRSPTCPLSYP